MTIKLLFIIDCYKNPYAGTEGQLMKLMRGLDASKVESALLILRDSDYDEKNDFPVPVDILNIGSITSPSSWIRLARYFSRKKREGFTLAHTFFCDASLICPPLLKLLGYRVIISRRDMGYWYTAANLAILRVNSLYVDRVIANSKAVKTITVLKEGYRPERINVIYNGYKEPDREPLEQAGIDLPGKHSVRIVLVANIRPIKRIQDAVYAVRNLSNENLDVALFVIGDGDNARLNELAGELGVGSMLRFLGPRSDTLRLLPLFDIGILCSESEGFSNTVIEYQQCGLPVVCSDVGGNPEIIEHGVNGFMYPKGDTQLLSDYLGTLVRDESLRKKMGQAGRERVTENYGMEKYLDMHQRVYDELVPR